MTVHEGRPLLYKLCYTNTIDVLQVMHMKPVTI